MDLQAIETVYRRYAPGYDFYFGAVLQAGRRAVVDGMRCRPEERILEEMRRVCRRSGDLYIVNHFRCANPAVGLLERMVAPFSSLMGFHPDFSLEDFVDRTGLDVAEKIPVNLLEYWTLLRSRNCKQRHAA